MANLLKQVDGAVTTSDVNVLTAGADKVLLIFEIVIANISGASGTSETVNIDANGTSIAEEIPVDVQQSFVYAPVGKLIVATSNSITLACSTNSKLTYHISYVEIDQA